MQEAVGKCTEEMDGVISLLSVDLGREALTQGCDSITYFSPVRVLCLIFVNQIHEEEPGAGKKLYQPRKQY